MALNRKGGVDDRRQAAMGRPVIPALEIFGDLLGRGLIVEVLECQADMVGAGTLEMAPRQRIECRLLAR